MLRFIKKQFLLLFFFQFFCRFLVEMHQNVLFQQIIKNEK